MKFTVQLIYKNHTLAFYCNKGIHTFNQFGMILYYNYSQTHYHFSRALLDTNKLANEINKCKYCIEIYVNLTQFNII